MTVNDTDPSVAAHRQSIDGSQNTFAGALTEEEDQKTLENAEEKSISEEVHYPAVLEVAPFPVLGSLEEITRSLSRVKSNQTPKGFKDEKSIIIVEDTSDAIKDAFKQTPYYTEGIRNPGWLSVLSCFLVNFFVFGTVFSWGDYQNLYLNEVYAGQTDLLKISFVGSAATALLLALGIFITPVIQKIGFRGTMVVGTIGAPLSLILASFATELWHIYLSQGILLGIASAFVFQPSITLPAQWFTARRGLATGIAVSGSGAGGVCLSPMVQSLIASIGYRNTLRVQGALGFGLLCISTALATSRYRPPKSANGENKWYHMFDKSLISRNYILLLTFSFFVPFGYLAPFFMAPAYVQHIGLDVSTGATMISVMSAANVVCRISLGYLADRVGKFNMMFTCTFSAGVFAMLIWQFSYNYGTFAAFSVLYGLTAGGFVSLLPVTTAGIVGVENIQKGLGMAYIMTVVGSLVGAPIIGLLVTSVNWTAAIQFCGAVQVFASIFMIILRMILSKGKIFAKV